MWQQLPMIVDTKRPRLTMWTPREEDPHNTFKGIDQSRIPSTFNPRTIDYSMNHAMLRKHS
jgi:hypothetical protein